MKLDATDLRYLDADAFRVLKAVETGSLTHEVVPTRLIAQTCGLQHSGLNKVLGDLAKRGLVGRERNIKYDGYRLTYGGYDWLAVKALRDNGCLTGVGTRIGVGKESDIYLAEADTVGNAHRVDNVEESDPLSRTTAILKMHRLGRISFRKIKEKRDYLKSRKDSPSWIFLSRLSAKREWDFLQALYHHGFPVPTPLAQSRHSILMSRIDGYPLRQIVNLPREHVASLYGSLMTLIVRLARAGLIHCDFNEFNIMIREIKEEGDDEKQPDRGEEWDAGANESVFRESWKGKDQDLPVGQTYLPRPIDHVGQEIGFEQVGRLPSNQPHQSFSKASSEASDTQNRTAGEESEDGRSDAEYESDAQSSHNVEDLEITLADGSQIEPILIDFPQMISVEHPNAENYFDRDVDGIRSFFARRFRFYPVSCPRFSDIVDGQRSGRRDRRNKISARKTTVGLETTDDEKGSLGLELDVLTNASGLGGGKECYQHSSDLQLSRLDLQEKSRIEEQEGTEARDCFDAKNPSDGGEDQEEPREVAEVRCEPGSGEESRGKRSDKNEPQSYTLPSKGAALKMAADGDERGVQLRVLMEKQRRQQKDEKHHGRKAQATKVGRAWRGGGGKGKTSDKALINTSEQF